ncbi:MAG: orotate phosphoribosyltransferase [Rhodothermaceae bacterium]
MANKEIIEIFEKTNALLNGHFVLTSGKHSNQYFQCAQVLQHTKHMETICTTLADHFRDFEIDVVISPAIGGICVGQEVARQLGKRFIFAERKTKDLELRRNFEIKEGEKVLVCEDVVTTGGSVFEVIDIVKERKGELVGVGIIVDRSNGKADFGVPTKSTLALEVVTYDPEECPLCKEGVPIEKPGSRK